LLLAAWWLGGKFHPSATTPLPVLDPGKANRKETFPILPDVQPPEAARPDAPAPEGKGKIRTTLELGKDGNTGFRIDVPGSPSNK
jgi:hypothetical protein